MLNAYYAGSHEEGMSLVSEFNELPPLQKDIQMVAWNVMDTSAGFGLARLFCIEGQMHNMWSLGVRTIDAQTHIDFFNRLAAFWKQYPSAIGSTWEIEYFSSEAVRAVPDASTAYPHRTVGAQEYVPSPSPRKRPG